MKGRQNWTLVIKPRDKWYHFNFRELWQYRDLLLLFVRRDFVQVYKQTILGPIWFILQPLLTTTVFTILLGYIANVSTDETPPFVFYLAGITFWTLFSESVTKNAATFTQNASVFGKVYFPRLIVPIGALILNYIKFLIQFVVMLGVVIYYANRDRIGDDGEVIGAMLNPNWHLIPVAFLLLFIIGVLALGTGIFISALTTKYRDLQHMVGFGIRLLMYGSSVILPISIFGEYAQYVRWNPLVPLVEAFKHIFIGKGAFSWMGIGYSAGFAVVLLFIALVMFRKVEKSFMDTV